MDRTAIILTMNLQYDQSVGPRDGSDAFLVKNSLIVAAIHLQTHNQILPRAVQIHGHRHLISRNGVRGLLQRISIGGEPYRCPISTDRDYLIAIRPFSPRLSFQSSAAIPH